MAFPAECRHATAGDGLGSIQPLEVINVKAVLQLIYKASAAGIAACAQWSWWPTDQPGGGACLHVHVSLHEPP